MTYDEAINLATALSDEEIWARVGIIAPGQYTVLFQLMDEVRVQEVESYDELRAENAWLYDMVKDAIAA